jgi:hypothetical protein
MSTITQTFKASLLLAFNTTIQIFIPLTWTTEPKWVCIKKCFVTLSTANGISFHCFQSIYLKLIFNQFIDYTKNIFGFLISRIMYKILYFLDNFTNTNIYIFNLIWSIFYHQYLSHCYFFIYAHFLKLNCFNTFATIFIHLRLIHVFTDCLF